MKGKRVPFVLLVILIIALPLLLIGIKQTLGGRSRAAAADKLETEGGSRVGNAVVTSDSSASGGSYVVLGINPTPTQTPNSPTPTINPSGPIPAFPGAQGGGAVSKGGRGGAVIEVTNLNDSGTGSLRACVQASGPRTCVFRVGGTINLSSGINIGNPYITIAGQTAPGGGIQLSGKNTNAHMITATTHDIILRYIKIRKGFSNCPDSAECGSGFIGFAGTYNSIIDHVSVSWNQDEGIGLWRDGTQPQNNITISWNLVAEGLSTHPTGFITGTNDSTSGLTDLDYHHNLVMNDSHRNPLLKNQRSRWINNIGYNHRYYSSQFGANMQVDVIGNLYKKGPMNGSAHEIQSFGSSIYVFGNKGWNQQDPSGNQWIMTRQVSGENGTESAAGNVEIPSSWRRTTPLPAQAFPIVAENVNNLENSLLPIVGASRRLDCNGNWVSNRDTTDTRLINQYQTNTGITSLVVNESDVGGFPTISGGTACTDTDHDGMPDTWESAKGLNPNNAADRNNIAPNGFTQLENYLNGV